MQFIFTLFLEWYVFQAAFNWILVSYPTSTTSKHYLCVQGSSSVTLATWLKASIALSLCTSVCWDRGQGSGGEEGIVGGLNNSLWTEVRPRRPPLSSPLTLHMRLLSQCQCQCKWKWRKVCRVWVSILFFRIVCIFNLLSLLIYVPHSFTVLVPVVNWWKQSSAWLAIAFRWLCCQTWWCKF